MRKITAIVFLMIISFYFILILGEITFGEKYEGVSEHYVEKGIQENRGANIVTSIVVNYRGFDTLGEVTVLFLTATGISFLLGSCKCKNPMKRIKGSFVLRAATETLFPVILLFGAYIFIHGHLTPGGGFQGGTVVASGFLLLLLSNRKYKVNHLPLTITESFAGISFVSIGILGLIFSKSFLANDIIPKGNWNELFSAGFIPLIYIAVGLKVGAELSGLLGDMFKTTEERK
ncbi:MAG: Na(+)/H(+) antiporter subunit B [Acidobacteriota bacterium]